MRDKIIGRKAECDRLGKCLSADTSELVIVYGRRRVGKTFLINQFFDGRFDFKITGAYNQPREIQLRNFQSEMDRQTQEKNSLPKDWIEAFEMLRFYLENCNREGKMVVFFDEMPWLDTPKSGFLSAFEWFWNDWGSLQDNLLFIVCGSATAWMVDNIAENKGGLFNRQTCKLYLEPFSLAETEKYLISRGIYWTRYDIAECYMIMGGIPYYLSLLDRELSYCDNIDNLFFRKRAEIWDEFGHLYHTLFNNSEQCIKVVEALSRKRIGLSRNEISSISKIPSNGTLTRILENLVESGFVRAYSCRGKRKDILYQLSDYYTMFYYRFIKDEYGRDEHFWRHAIDNPSRRAWVGFTFESLCKDHIKQIKQKLGISGVLSEESAWLVHGDNEQDGAQIDLLIDRRDRVVNICEMKFSIDEFTIDKEYEANLRRKIEVFKNASKTRKNIQLTMITSFGIHRNMYSNLVQSEVVLDDLFKEVE